VNPGILSPSFLSITSCSRFSPPGKDPFGWQPFSLALMNLPSTDGGQDFLDETGRRFFLLFLIKFLPERKTSGFCISERVPLTPAAPSEIRTTRF